MESKQSYISEIISQHNEDSTKVAQRLFKKNPHPSIFILMIQLFLFPAIHFLITYLKSFKKGSPGVIDSFLYAFYHYLIISKYASLAYNKKN